MLIRKDEISIYVVHGDHKVRPIADEPHSQMIAFSGEMWGKTVVIRARNDSEFSEGQKAVKYHYHGSTKVRINVGGKAELWFIQRNVSTKGG